MILYLQTLTFSPIVFYLGFKVIGVLDQAVAPAWFPEETCQCCFLSIPGSFLRQQCTVLFFVAALFDIVSIGVRNFVIQKYPFKLKLVFDSLLIACKI